MKKLCCYGTMFCRALEEVELDVPDDTLLSIADESLADYLQKMIEDLMSLTKW
jgi:hypothetical protein